MKKRIFIGLLIMSLLLIGCGNENKNKNEEFITKFYTIQDYTKINGKNFDIEYPNTKFLDEIKAMMTEEAFNNMIAERYPSAIVHAAEYGKFNIEVKEIKITENSKDEDAVVYNYTANLKLKYADKEENEDINGQFTVKKIDGEYKITLFNKIGIPDKFFELLRNYYE